MTMPHQGGATTLALFASSWAIMVAVLMVPLTLPVAAVLWQGQAGDPRRGLSLGLFWGAYVGVWMVVGLGLWAVRGALPTDAGALLVAGVYQLTPLKRSCLRLCRAPLALVYRFYRPGLVGAVTFGLRYAGTCVGCCWALMAAMMLVSAMAVWVVAPLAAVAVLERVLPARAAYRLGTAAGLAGVMAGLAGVVARLAESGPHP
ncbi:MAG: DUF2182 domain-containing protein [Firmicutes bacterium]|nr:DUF2182 domain-containing protein [Bacillota bacterium]